MKNTLSINNNKRVRGQILTLLYAVHPSPIEVRTLSNALLDGNYITSPDIAAHVDYLEEKGYIRRVGQDDSARIPGMLPVTTFVKLAADGVDLMEGTTEDHGVDV
ncbi:hypothetical protein LJC42_06975 [Eubacteriales bacterium OttesenSCG-928-K08]|nr:hypothetical protein [Eubacteriales bacterium OttesenSCG-928-K08]